MSIEFIVSHKVYLENTFEIMKYTNNVIDTLPVGQVPTGIKFDLLNIILFLDNIFNTSHHHIKN